jgi:hypothetical protein
VPEILDQALNVQGLGPSPSKKMHLAGASELGPVSTVQESAEDTASMLIEPQATGERQKT